MKHAPIDIEARADRAEALFRQGFNCAQSVAAAYHDLYGMDETMMLRLSASFGGGIGRMRETCGAACGMFLLAGLETGSATPGDRAGKNANYALVQQLAAEFIKRNGALRCADLLGLPQTGHAETAHQPQSEERTPGFYAKRPCVQMVREAARIYGEYLNGN